MGLKECRRCLFTEDFAAIDAEQCEYCDLHDALEQSTAKGSLTGLTNQIKRKGRKKKYDCIIGISGGLDSSTMLFAAVEKWGLNPLVIHFDNHYNAPEAKHNMNQLIQKLGVDAIIFHVNKREYDKLNRAFLRAGVPDADIPNDIAMTKLMYETARQYGIKYILNGHDFRTEGSTPRKWTYMDAKYIQSVYCAYNQGENLVSYPLFTVFDQLRYAWLGIKNVRPFYFITDRSELEGEMKELIGWQDYGAKHCENVYTEFVGAKLLPEKFKIDKRIVYLSAQVRSGNLSKDDARQEMEKSVDFDMDKLPAQVRQQAELALKSLHGQRMMYKRYNFKKYRWVWWLLSKLRVVPHTFYVKYCT